MKQLWEKSSLSLYCTAHKMTPTRHMQLSSSDHKLSGLGLVRPADVDAGMVTPRVPNHQVCCKDNHISGDRLSIWSKEKATKNNRTGSDESKEIAIEKSGDDFLGLLVAWETAQKREAALWAGEPTCNYTSWPTGGSVTFQSGFTEVVTVAQS